MNDRVGLVIVCEGALGDGVVSVTLSAAPEHPRDPHWIGSFEYVELNAAKE